MADFPDYIWDKSTGYLIITESQEPFQDPGEFMIGPIEFSDIDQINQFLKEYNYSGTVGIRLQK
tara:strand:+ start:196 stop:387 length:192 start_codon:yes stop_codon:yes gene_type:complete